MKITPLLNSRVVAGIFCAGAVLFMAAGASAQNLYDSEQYSGAIDVFNSSGTPTTFIPSTQPLGKQIAFDSSGDLFVGNNGTAGITKITPNGTASSFGSGFNEPSGVAVNGAGDVFVANTGNGEIIEVALNGSESLFATGLDNPGFLTFNSAGDLLEADSGSGNIYEFAPNGMKTLYASGFQIPVGLAFNSAGDLFVANGLSQNAGYISEMTPSGTSTILTGLDGPQGLAVNNAGDLFIAVAIGYIEEITPAGASVFSTQVQSPIGLAFAPVPEPSTLALLAVGASAVALRLRRKKN